MKSIYLKNNIEQRIFSRLFLTGLLPALILLCISSSLLAQDKSPSAKWTEQDYLTALKFFEDGGAWCFRVLPKSTVAINSEQTWIILILNREDSPKRTYQLGSVNMTDNKSDSAIYSSMKVLSLYDDQEALDNFLRRYADKIKPGGLAATLVNAHPIKEGEPYKPITEIKLTKKGLLDLFK